MTCAYSKFGCVWKGRADERTRHVSENHLKHLSLKCKWLETKVDIYQFEISALKDDVSFHFPTFHCALSIASHPSHRDR